MLKKVFRLLVRMALIGSSIHLARIGLKRWIDGPEPAPGDPGDRWARVTEAPRAAPPANPGAPADPAAAAEPQPAASGTARRPGRGASTGAQAGPSGTWVTPDESGAAPSTHPVKVKLSSRLYREPGASGYDRTRPDRCYVSAEAAEADGFSRAKR